MPRRKKEDINEEIKETKVAKTKKETATKKTTKTVAEKKEPAKKTTKAVVDKEDKKEAKPKKTTKKSTTKKETRSTTKKSEEKEPKVKKTTTAKKTSSVKKPTKETEPKEKPIRHNDMYDDYDDEEDNEITNPFLVEEDEEEDNDEFTEDDLKASESFDETEYEAEYEKEQAEKMGKRKYKKVFSTSSHSEQVRQKFFDICERYNSGDEQTKKDACEDAINELQNFVHFVIKRKYSTYTKYYEDLVQEGILGILKGMEKYDPSKSLPTTYFNLYIIHEISKYIDTEVNKTTSHYSSNLTKINRVIDNFEQTGRKWDVNDIVVETGLNMETVVQCLNIKECKNEVYIDAEETPEFNIKDNHMTPEQEVIENERTNVLTDAIKTLLPEEQKVLTYRYGLGGTKVISYKEIAKQMGISIEKVRKYRHDAIRKLKYKATVRNTFKEYINDEEEKLRNSTQVALVQSDLATSMLDEIEELDIDFDSIFNDDDDM